MAYKIAIDNGHGINTAGKRTPKMPDGRVIHEWEFNHPTAKKLDEILKRCGFETLMVSDTKEDTPLATRTARANNAKADLFVSIHFNAFKGIWGDHGGISSHYYPTSVKGKKLAEIVQAELVRATGLRDRKAQSSNFFVLRETKMPAILNECGFMDNLAEAKLMLDEDYQWEVAEAITKGVCQYFGVKYVPKPQPIPDEQPSGKLYRVQIGAFAVKANAEKLASELKSKGYSAIIKEE